MRCRAWLATPPGSGGVAIIELAGDVEALLAAVAPPSPWPIGNCALRCLASIDSGLVIRLAEDRVHLTPHGGPQIVAQITEALVRYGAEWLDTAPHDMFGEAIDAVEAAALGAIAQAQSPAAIPLLLEQPARWRRDASALTEDDDARSNRLNRLIVPPVVAVVGAPNVGKSTLLNRLVGRETVVVSQTPGTTRDHVGVLVDLGGLVVEWIDTPGLRTTADAIEQDAIQGAAEAIAGADVVVRMLSPDTVETVDSGSVEELIVISKADLTGAHDLADTRGGLLISAVRGDGIETLVQTIRDRLVPDADLKHPGRWNFHGRDPRVYDVPSKTVPSALGRSPE